MKDLWEWFEAFNTCQPASWIKKAILINSAESRLRDSSLTALGSFMMKDSASCRTL